MKAIIFGATGMIGRGVLLECLHHPEVEQVLCVGRSQLAMNHPKLKQIVHSDFTDFSGIENQLRDYDACFFCLGVSAAGMKEEDYRRITYDYCMAVAKTLYRLNPEMSFTYISGQGTDSTEKGRMMWARVKGKLENDLLKLGFKKADMFRPGLIIPRRGIQSRTPGYRIAYTWLGWLLKIIQRLAPDSITDTSRLGQAMINAHLKPVGKSILTPKDINALARGDNLA